MSFKLTGISFVLKAYKIKNMLYQEKWLAKALFYNFLYSRVNEINH